MPKDGMDRRAYRAAKFGSWERSRALDAQAAAAGAADGLVFRHDLMARTPNTLASHVLIRLAHEVGGAVVQDRVVEALFAAYFTRGRDVGDPAVLVDLGAEAGIDRARVVEHPADPAGAGAVKHGEERARGLGLDGRHLFSGARPVPVIVRELREASAVSASRRAGATSPMDAGHVLG